MRSKPQFYRFHILDFPRFLVWSLQSAFTPFLGGPPQKRKVGVVPYLFACHEMCNTAM